ncbi:MAG: FAD-binding protein [Ignavibacteriae bacterium]|nr:FAD-binding protein [Ignavibacteriota bacterium]
MKRVLLNEAQVAALVAIVGAEYVKTDAESLEVHGQDETEDLLFLPSVVVEPANTAEVSAIMRYANEHGLPVTPRGGGTGLSGGSLPVAGGIVLSMRRFNRIIEIDRQNLQATVEPGVITQKFQEEVEAAGLSYPPDPASKGSCFIGGNVAECAGGPHAVKYGITKDYVLAIEAVLPNGDIFTTGARVLKNVSGYNVTQLIIGSEGTLAVITKIYVRLVPITRIRKVVLVAFNTLEDAAAAVASIFQRGITPSALEFLERAAVQAAEERQGKKFPNSEAAAQLLIEVDGNHEEALTEEITAIAEVVEQHNAADILLAEDRAKVEEVWALRRGIGEAVKGISAYKEEDTVVPRANLPQLVKGVKEICAKYGLTSICYGHAGDGNVHVNILKNTLDEETWERVNDPAIREIFALTVSLGGTISAEHGIGYVQRSYLPIGVSQVELGLMREIKRVFDPKGILNPGKVLLD